MEQKETQLELNFPKFEELTLYHLVDRDFEIENLYTMGGFKPNARHIASEHGCELEFRQSEFINPRRNIQFTSSYLARHGIGEDNSCISAVLVGRDLGQLYRARDLIHRIHGVAPFKDGRVNISGKKTIFSA